MNRYLGFIQQKLQCCKEGWDFFNKNCNSAATGNNREKRTAMMGESVTGQNDGENGWIQREFQWDLHVVQDFFRSIILYAVCFVFCLWFLLIWYRVSYVLLSFREGRWGDKKFKCFTNFKTRKRRCPNLGK